MKNLIYIILLTVSLPAITLHHAMSLINTNALQLHMLDKNLSAKQQNINKAKRLFPNNPIFRASFSRIDFSPNAYNFKISQKINIASQAHYKTLMAQNSYKAASLNIKQTKILLTAQVQKIFYKTWLDKQNIAIVDNILIYENQLQQQIKNKINSGAQLQGSDAIVQVSISQYKSEKTQYMLDLHVQKIRLSNILNRHIRSINTSFKKDFSNITLTNLNKQIGKNYRILMISHQIDRLRANLQMLQKSRYFSYVKLGFNYGLNANNITNARSETVTLSLPIPVINYHQYSIASLMDKISNLQYKKELTANRIKADVKIYFSRLQASVKLVLLYKTTVLKELKSYLNTTKLRYANGLIPLEVMQSAFMNFTSTKQRYVQESYDILLDKLNIYQELSHD